MNLIVFDIDGTLTNTTQVDDECFIAAFQKVFGLDIKGFPWDTLKNVTDWGITEEIIQNRLNRLPTDIEYQQMLDEFVGLLNQTWQTQPAQFAEVPGANAFFQTIKTTPKFGLGIATGSWEASALVKLKGIGIQAKGIPFSNASFHKSREAITRHAIRQAKEQYQTEFENIIYFGDGAWDYSTCQNLGIQFVGIDVKRNDKLKKLGAKNVFHDFGDTASILALLP